MGQGTSRTTGLGVILQLLKSLMLGKGLLKYKGSTNVLQQYTKSYPKIWLKTLTKEISGNKHFSIIAPLESRSSTNGW